MLRYPRETASIFPSTCLSLSFSYSLPFLSPFYWLLVPSLVALFFHSDKLETAAFCPIVSHFFPSSELSCSSARFPRARPFARTSSSRDRRVFSSLSIPLSVYISLSVSLVDERSSRSNALEMNHAGLDGRVRMYRVPGKAAFLRRLEKEKERSLPRARMPRSFARSGRNLSKSDFKDGRRASIPLFVIVVREILRAVFLDQFPGIMIKDHFWNNSFLKSIRIVVSWIF